MAEVLYSVESGIGQLVINRPERRNALNSAVLAGMRTALKSAAEDPEVRVIAISGAGDKVFCAGADLAATLAGDEGKSGFSRSDFRGLLLDILGCPKPTIALARGHVMAGGLGIFLACDLALACDDVHFSTPEIRVGMFPMMVLALLYRNVGRKRATEMMFLGERIPANTARDYGIVNHTFPRDRFDASSGEYLMKLAGLSSSILKSGKDAILRLEIKDLAEELEYLEEALAGVMTKEDCREGMRAFVEKRKPAWRHK